MELGGQVRTIELKTLQFVIIVFRAHFRGYNGLKSIKKKIEIRKCPLKIQFYFNKILISLM